MTCLAAALIEAEFVNGTEMWLATMLNISGWITLFVLVSAPGPMRLLRSTFKWVGETKRAQAVRASKTTEADANAMSA